MTNAELKAKKVAELREIATQLGISKPESKKKQELIDAIIGGGNAEPKTEEKTEPTLFEEKEVISKEIKATPEKRKPRKRVEKPTETEQIKPEKKVQDPSNKNDSQSPQPEKSHGDEQKRKNNDKANRNNPNYKGNKTNDNKNGDRKNNDNRNNHKKPNHKKQKQNCLLFRRPSRPLLVESWRGTAK